MVSSNKGDPSRKSGTMKGIAKKKSIFRRIDLWRLQLMCARKDLGKGLDYNAMPKLLGKRNESPLSLYSIREFLRSHHSSVIQLLYSAREALLTRCFSRTAAILGELLLIQIQTREYFYQCSKKGTSSRFIAPYIRGHCLQLGWVIYMLFHDTTIAEKGTYSDFTKTNSTHLRRYAFIARQRLFQLQGTSNDFEAMKNRVIQIETNPSFFRVPVRIPLIITAIGLHNNSCYIYQPWLHWFTGVGHHYRWSEESRVSGDENDFCIKKLEQNPDVINLTQSNFELKKMYIDTTLDLSRANYLTPFFPTQTFLLMHLYITMGEYDNAVNAAQHGYRNNLASTDALALYILTLRSVGEKVTLSQKEWSKLYLKALKMDPLQLAALRDLHLQYVDGGVPICMLVEGFLTHLDVCAQCQKVGLGNNNYEDEEELVCPSNAWQYLSECLNQAAEQALVYLPEEMEDWVDLYKDKIRMEVDAEADQDKQMWNQWLIIAQMIQDRAYWWQHTHFEQTTLPKKIATFDQGKDLCYRSICACYILGSDSQYVKKTNKIVKKYEQLQSEREDLKRNRLICHHIINTYNELKQRKERKQKQANQGDILVYKEKRQANKESYGVFQSFQQTQDTDKEQAFEKNQVLPKQWWQMFPFKGKRET